MTPAWQTGSDIELATRFEAARWAAAAGDADAWVSELQGGGIGRGFDVYEPVDGDRQARWVWSAISRGMKGAIFWAWRDEVFGYEAAGFGVAGNDGRAQSRLTALRRVTAVLREHRETLGSYQADLPEAGVLFSGPAYQLDWVQRGDSELAQASVVGWMTTLERLQAPYRVVDTGHLDDLDSLRLLVLPWPLVIPDEAAGRILAWVRAGGHLITEAELAAYDQYGFYRYGPDRPLAAGLGLEHQGRRPLEPNAELPVTTGGSVRSAVLTEALAATGDVLAVNADGEPAIVAAAAGDGRVLAFGTFPGQPAGPERSATLERLLAEELAGAGVTQAFTVSPSDGELLHWRAGTDARGNRLLFILTRAGDTPVTVRPAGSSAALSGDVADLAGGVTWKAVTDSEGPGWSGRTGPDGAAILFWPKAG